MATPSERESEAEENEKQIPCQQTHNLLSLYLGVSFAVFLAYIPEYSLSLLPNLQTQIKETDEQLKQMKARRKEDSKANARVVEIFATHRNSWQVEEKQLLLQIQDQRAKIEELKKETDESKRRIDELRDIIGFISTTTAGGEQEEEQMEDQLNFSNVGHNENFPFTSDSFASASYKFWADRQDIQYESLESLYHTKHFIARSESTGVSSKLKLLEQELSNLERIGKSNFSRLPSLMRKQARRYQSLTAKMDDLCRRMQASDPSELSLEFRTQRQSDFLVEAFRLQRHASETGQKLMMLQTEIGKSCNYRDDVDVGSSGKVGVKRSMDSIRNNLQEVQRNLEIWLARMIGELEGILARDGSCSSRVREYCVYRYNNHFVQ